MKEYLEFAIEIARKAGEIMEKYFYEEGESRYKEDETIVTKADTEINSYLIEKVKESYPSHSVDGEEEKFGNSNYVWVCDPVDGTAMYARHIPVAVFSLALVIDGESKVGVVYDPFTQNMYTAIKGEGAFVNGNKILVNDLDLNDIKGVSHFDMWKKSGYDLTPMVEELSNKTFLVSLGSAIRGCMGVATGDFTASFFPGSVNKNCDIAAAKVIVEEAGGMVTDLFGKEQRYDMTINGAIISNGKVHSELIELTKKYLTNMDYQK